MKRRLGSAIVALFCLAFAAFCAWLFGSVTVITCARIEPAQVNCEVRETLLGWLPLGKPQTLRHVQYAGLDFIAGGDDGYNTNYLVLHTEAQELRIEFFDYSSVVDANERFDAFFSSSEPAFTYHQTSGWVGGICGGFLFLDVLFFAGIFAAGAFPRRKPQN